jgi:SsrA-binding protein
LIFKKFSVFSVVKFGRMMAEKIICQNKKARHDYHILDTYEAGLVLKGSEVKSCRSGSANLKDSYARFKDGEIYLIDTHISSYAYAHQFNHDPLRERKLLFHKSEIKKLYGKIREKGLTLIPLKMYFKDGKVKVEMAVVKGKRLHDKREAIKRKDLAREVEKEFRGKKVKGRL